MNVVDQQIGQSSLNKLVNYKNVRGKTSKMSKIELKSDQTASE